MKCNSCRDNPVRINLEEVDKLEKKYDEEIKKEQKEEETKKETKKEKNIEQEKERYEKEQEEIGNENESFFPDNLDELYPDNAEIKDHIQGPIKGVCGYCNKDLSSENCITKTINGIKYEFCSDECLENFMDALHFRDEEI